MLLYLRAISHITIDGLEFQGANRTALAIFGLNGNDATLGLGITIRNCDIMNSGANAIDAIEVVGFLVENNTLKKRLE